jgi:predicted RNA-binding Zn ribbon-like protein
LADDFEKAWPGIGVGGAVALDFVNTLDWRLRERPIENLASFEALLRWAWSAGAMNLAEARASRRWAAAHPRRAARALASAIEVREAIAAVFQSVARGEPLPTQPLSRLEAACRAAWAARTLEARGRAADWTWRGDPPSPDRAVWAAALDAGRLLVADERDRIRECGDALCGWLFLDTSRNHTRRWCSMAGCGNRNKARAYQKRAAAERRKTARRGAAPPGAGRPG